MSDLNRTPRSYVWGPVFMVGVLGLLLARTSGCSSSKKHDPDPPVSGDCEGLQIGETKEKACATGAGKITYVCVDSGLQEVANQCDNLGGTKKACSSVVTFSQVQPVLALNCAGCHAGIDTYDRARSWYEKINANVQVGSAQHMPPGKQLDAGPLATIAKWKADNFLKADECDGTTTTPGGPARPNSLSFPEIEQAMFADISGLNVNDQQDYRYLLYTDRFHAGDSAADLEIYKQSAIKALASVSPERTFYPPVEIAPGVLRVNIDELGISAAQWNKIENASQLQFESETGVGQVLKTLTGTRLPWMYVVDFQDVALRNASIYYDLIKAPATLNQLFNDLGVDFADDLKESKATLVGFNGSLLSPAANRLMARFEAEENGGVLWLTEDTGPIKSDQQDIFKNPLIAAGGGQANLKFAAGEMLFTLPNGMMGSFLADAAGRRLDFADPNVVHDFTTNPSAPIIRVGLSCLRCHASGYLAATDEVRKSVLGGSNIGAADAQRAIALYRRQSEVDSLLAKDNSENAATLKKYGLDATQSDPVNKTSDRFLGDMKLADIAGFFAESGKDFTEGCINVSANVQAKVSQLRQGNTLSHDQFVLAVKTIVDECRKFQDPL